VRGVISCGDGISEYNSHSPSFVNKKSQSFSNNKFITYNSHINICKPFKAIELKTPKTTLNANKKNINNKSSLNLNEKRMKKDSIFNYILSMNSVDNYANDSKYNYNILNLKTNNNINNECNKFLIKEKNFGVSSTPNLGDTGNVSKLINHKKKNLAKNDININFNFIPNNFQRYLKNNRYQGETVKTITNKNYSNIEPTLNIKNNINLLGKHKSFNSVNKISIDNINNNFLSHHRYSLNNVKINVPINTIVQRKLTDINIENDFKIIKSQLNRNKVENLKKNELNNPGTLIYDINNKKGNNNYIKEYVLTTKDKNKYKKKYNNYEKRNSFLNKVKKETINQLFNGINSNRTHNKYYKYQAQNYPPPKGKDISCSLKYSPGFKAYNYLNNPIQKNNFF
jgi:hypothetical protein